MMAPRNDLAWLVVSDIDDTLTGDRQALFDLRDAMRRAEEPLRFVLNSSRPAVSVDETIRDYFPPDFILDGIVTGLGTEMRIGNHAVSDWSERFRAWPRQEIVDLVLSFGHRPHPDEFQTPAKASFSVSSHNEVAILMAALEARALPFQVIFSGESDLDLLAPGAGKDEALRFLAHRFEISEGRVIAAGDSGNDLAMFEVADRAIAVGNARAELRHSAPRHKTYFARANHAAGVLEGLRAFGVLAS